MKRDLSLPPSLSLDSHYELTKVLSTSVGSDFFKTLVEVLARSLGFKFVLVGELMPGNPKRVVTHAVWAGDALGDNIEYDLRGTPCENVLKGDNCCYPKNVQSLFPEDGMLVDMGAESYFGMPLRDSNKQPFGLLLAVHTSPIDNSESVAKFLEIAGIRASYELERQRAEINLQAKNHFLSNVFESINQPFCVIDIENYEVVMANSASRADMSSENGKCYSVFFGFETPCSHHGQKCPIDSIRKDGLPVTLEQIRKGPGGEDTTYEILGYPIKDKAGKVVQIIEHKIDITERRRIVRELQNSESRFRSLFDHFVIGLYRTTPDGEILMANKALVEMLGYDSFEELAARNMDDEGYEPRYPREEFKGEIEKYGVIAGLEAAWEKKDGSTLNLRENVQPICDDQGNISFYDGSVEDITLQKLAEKEILESAEKYSAIFHYSNDGIILHDSKGKVLEANLRMAKMLGYSTDELLGMNVSEFYPPEVFQVSMPRFGKVIREGHDQMETDLIRKNGTRFFSEISTSLLELKGEPIIQCVIRDVSERKKAELALRLERDRASTYFEGVHLIMLVLNMSGTVELINEEGARMLGCPKDDIVGKSWVDMFTPERSRKRKHARIKEIQKNPEALLKYAENMIVTSSGEELRVAWHNSIIYDSQGEPSAILSSGEDITDRLRMESLLRESHKMEALGRLAGGIAHDFNNMLQGMTLFCESAFKHLPEGSLAGEEISAIMQMADHGAGMVKQLMAFGRQGAENPRVLNLNRQLIHIERLMRRITGEDVRVEFRLADKLKNFKMDTSQLEEVLLNIVLNARDAMPDGGTVTVETASIGESELNPEFIKKPCPEGYVKLSIRDTGIGMTPEVKDKMFEPFFSTKDDVRGTGLGLASVYGIIQKNGGFIQVDSAPGKGTDFQIYFPAVSEAMENAEARQEFSVIQGAGRTVMIAEDEPAIRNKLSMSLKEWGFQVIDAENVEEALQKGSEPGLKLDLLVTDIRMPGGDGRDVARKLSECHEGLQVILISGYVNSSSHSEANENTRFLQKPFSLEDLAQTLTLLLSDVEPDS